MRRLLALTTTTLVCALAPSDTRPFLTLLDGSGSQRLSASMVDRFPTWLFDGAWQRVPDSDGFAYRPLAPLALAFGRRHFLFLGSQRAGS